MNEKVNATVNEEQVNQATEQATEINENVNQQDQPAAKKDSFFSKLGSGVKANAGKIGIAMGATALAGAAVYFGVPAAEKFIVKAVGKALDGHTVTIGLEQLAQLNEMAAPAAEAAAEVVADAVESTI